MVFFFPGVAAAVNTQVNVINGSTSLTNASSFSTGTLPTSTSDVTWTNGTYSPTAFALNTPTNSGGNTTVSWGTLNVLTPTPLTIDNLQSDGSVSNTCTLTLYGHDSVSGNTNDWIYLAPNATSVNIGCNPGSEGSLALSLMGNGNFDIGGGTLTIGSDIPLIPFSRNWTKTGGGTLTLSGTGSTRGVLAASAGTVNISGSLTGGGLAVGAGTVNVSGSLILRDQVGGLGGVFGNGVSVGNTASNAVLNISGSVSVAYAMSVGDSNGVGAVYQTGGSLIATNPLGYDNLSIGNVAGSYGYYDAVGGSMTVYGIAVGGENNNGGTANFNSYMGNGIMDINGGNVNCTGWFVISRSSLTQAQIGVLNLYSGSLSYAGGGFYCNAGSGQTSIVNMMGGSLSTSNNSSIVFYSGTGTGIMNLNGGVATVHGISGTGFVNFSGGTLRPSAATSSLLAVTSATIYGGGATIDNNGFAVTNAQPLLAPTGYGVSSITVNNGGAGYIAPPIVTISGGTGSNATAIAQINPVSGAVTNFLVTCAGNGYLSDDTLVVSFTGGGGSGAAANTPVLAANTSGGLTVLGSGTLTLSGASTYTGNTVVTNGNLALGSGGSIANSAVIKVGANATFDVSATAFDLGATQMFEGDGIVNGSFTNDGAIVVTNPVNPVSTLTFNDNLILQSDGVIAVHLDKDIAPGATNDVVSCGGTVTYGGTLAVTNLGGTLQAGDSFPLFEASGWAGNFTAITGSPGAGLAYSFDPNSGVLSVVPLSFVETNAYLASIALSPIGVLSPAFAANTFTYSATEAYGSTPSVTATVAVPNATLELLYDGVTNGLVSGQPSSSLALDPDPRNVNSIGVLVTAPDGVTTNLYTVNVTQLPTLFPQPVMAQTVNGNQLVLSWPVNYDTYRLEMQTNNLSNGVSSNPNDWETVKQGITNYVVDFGSISADTNNCEFYRLVYP